MPEHYRKNPRRSRAEIIAVWEAIDGAVRNKGQEIVDRTKKEKRKDGRLAVDEDREGDLPRPEQEGG